MSLPDFERLAHFCHEANRGLQRANGEEESKPWPHETKGIRDTTLEGVTWRYYNIDAPDSACHDHWAETKRAAGWVFGPTKDEKAKTHPCLVPYHQLPVAQRAKDAVFTAIIRALAYG